ncbi:MAG: hypothetical protein JSV55_11720, partial [Deltaproteobacteria bacterium]
DSVMGLIYNAPLLHTENNTRQNISMPNKTESDFAFAFAAESKAVTHSSAFALKAGSEDDPHIAHFFRAVAAAESVQA